MQAEYKTTVEQREQAARWKREHPLQAAANQKRYREKHRAELTAQQRERRHAEGYKKPDLGKARELNRRCRRALRGKVLQALGGKCARCGFDDWRALQIDHVGGGGTKELNSMSAWRFSRAVLAEVEEGSQKYQLLCANCNWIKRHENNECHSM